MNKLITILVLALNVFVFTTAQVVPDPPVFINVNVDPETGFTSFFWNPSPSPEVDGYVIFKENALQGGYNPIDTVWGLDTTYFLWESINGTLLSESYVIGAIDTSGTNDRESPYTKPHKTMFLQTKTFNSCNISIELGWNPYIGWDTNFSYYTIHRKKDLENWDTIADYNGLDTLFTDFNIEPYSTYCYYIEAHHKDGITNSTCYQCSIPAITKKPPDSIYAYGTRFIDENLVQLIFFTDPTSELADYYLVRYNETTQLYDTVKRIESLGEATIMLGDALPAPGSYSYRLYAMNQCGRVAVSSNPANLVWLKASNRNFQNFLDWNLYHTWSNGIESYSVYRSIDGATPQLIHTQFPPDSSYTDNIEDVIYDATQGVFCYSIEAMVTSADQSDTLGVSRSNTICLTPEPRLFIPNAFTPNDDGLNEEFKPVLTFTPLEYIFVIRSRWGNTIFKTNDPQAAWDGHDGGQNVPDGVYMYYIKAIAPGGQVVEKNGKVTVLYPNK